MADLIFIMPDMSVSHAMLLWIWGPLRISFTEIAGWEALIGTYLTNKLSTFMTCYKRSRSVRIQVSENIRAVF